MSRHGRQDDMDRYTGNGHDPNRPVPREDPGGSHGKPDDTGEDDQGDKGEGT